MVWPQRDPVARALSVSLFRKIDSIPAKMGFIGRIYRELAVLQDEPDSAEARRDTDRCQTQSDCRSGCTVRWVDWRVNDEQHAKGG